jgi:hypothetical protein
MSRWRLVDSWLLAGGVVVGLGVGWNCQESEGEWAGCDSTGTECSAGDLVLTTDCVPVEDGDWEPFCDGVCECGTARSSLPCDFGRCMPADWVPPEEGWLRPGEAASGRSVVCVRPDPGGSGRMVAKQGCFEDDGRVRCARDPVAGGNSCE